MDSVGAYEAKTHLAQLLDRVAKGERIAILRHGTAVAVLQPAGNKTRTPRETIAQIKAFRTGRRLEGVTVREMIEEGRR